jgi:hypothetical protein
VLCFRPLPLVPLTTIGSVVAYAAERADFLDINKATAEQRKGCSLVWARPTQKRLSRADRISVSEQSKYKIVVKQK